MLSLLIDELLVLCKLLPVRSLRSVKISLALLQTLFGL